MSKNPCSCIGENFLLHISSPNREVILIHDLSDWVIEDGFVFPDFYLLNILHPDGRTEVVEVSPENGFLIPSKDFVDGVYEFSLDNCGVLYTQKELLIPNMECSLDLAIIEKDNDRDLALIQDIFDDLFVAKSSANIGNYTAANSILSMAKDKLTNISCDCTCK
jgi:hypothetical protein